MRIRCLLCLSKRGRPGVASPLGEGLGRNVNWCSQIFGNRGPWFRAVLCWFVFSQSVMAQCSQQGGRPSPPSNFPSVSQAAGSSNSTDEPTAPGDAPTSSANSCDVSQLRTCFKDFLADQAGIWTSPFRLRAQDALWLVPLAGATAVSLNYDVQTLQQVSTSPNRIRISNDLSNAGAYGAIGVAGATYLIGKITHNETARETGVLSLEAIADASVVTEVLKLATNRERPDVGTGQGHFWPDGTHLYNERFLSIRTCHRCVGFFACGCGRDPWSPVASSWPLRRCDRSECRSRNEQESFSLGRRRRLSHRVSGGRIRVSATFNLL